ncbi:MAG: hypothetical protein ACLTUC_05800 [Anaerobutyricum soehngenii]
MRPAITFFNIQLSNSREQIDREKNFYDCSSGRLPLYQVIEKTGVGERCVLLTLTEKELCETGLDRNAN